MTCAHHTTLRCLSSLLIFTRRLCRGASAPPFADEVLLLVEAAQVVFFGEAGCLAESGFAVGAAESGFAIGTVLLAGSATRKSGPSSRVLARASRPYIFLLHNTSNSQSKFVRRAYRILIISILTRGL